MKKYEEIEGITRRGFLKGVGVGAISFSLSLNVLELKAEASSGAQYSYRAWEDVYRNKWKWDKVSKSFHPINCLGHCSFNVYVKDGIVWREEQDAQYPFFPEAGVPDYNPRGCQKGTCLSDYMYGGQRVKYPLKRVGKRGEGKWKRISWDDALSEIAEKMMGIIKDKGPEAVTIFEGANGGNDLVTLAGFVRFGSLLGCTLPENMAGLGDLFSGLTITWGHPSSVGISSDWFKSKCLLLWFFNPVATRIPDCHFICEARYNGTQIVAISPEYAPTAIHSDLWVNPRPGTDLSLALAMANIIISEKLYDNSYVKEFTDLPLLIRADNNRFLRESDVKREGRESIFYFWDLASGGIKEAPGTGSLERSFVVDLEKARSIALNGIDPSLEGERVVETLMGKVKVRPVFQLLKERLGEYTPENVSRETGIKADLIKKLAYDFAQAKPAMIICGFAANKWYHGDLILRSMALLAALTGNVGISGGGIYSWIQFVPPGLFRLADMKNSRVLPSLVWDYIHGGLKDLNEQYYNAEIGASTDKYLWEAIEKGWIPHWPKKGSPKMIIFAGDNALRWRRANEFWRERLWPKLDLIVTITPFMSSTGLYSDIVLPAAAPYEKSSIMIHPLNPFIHASHPVTDPLGEALSDWQILKRLAKKAEKSSRSMALKLYKDEEFGITRNFGSMYDDFTLSGALEDDGAVIDFMLKNSFPGAEGLTYEKISHVGYGLPMGFNPKEATLQEGPVIPNPLNEMIRRKLSFPTLTGRQQFFIEHEWYIELGEDLPAYKRPLSSNRYLLRFITAHARHGIHSLFRDGRLLLRLQRGGPVLYINPKDAKARKITDGDKIRVFNNVGELITHAKVWPGLPEGEVFMYHGWDRQMSESHTNYNTLSGSAGLIKPTQIAGGYGHLYYRFWQWGPNQIDKDVTVEVEGVKE